MRVGHTCSALALTLSTIARRAFDRDGDRMADFLDPLGNAFAIRPNVHDDDVAFEAQPRSARGNLIPVLPQTAKCGVDLGVGMVRPRKMLTEVALHVRDGWHPRQTGLAACPDVPAVQLGLVARPFRPEPSAEQDPSALRTWRASEIDQVRLAGPLSFPTHSRNRPCGADEVGLGRRTPRVLVQRVMRLAHGTRVAHVARNREQSTSTAATRVPSPPSSCGPGADRAALGGGSKVTFSQVRGVGRRGIEPRTRGLKVRCSAS
jgi:hypothetical protein